MFVQPASHKQRGNAAHDRADLGEADQLIIGWRRDRGNRGAVKSIVVYPRNACARAYIFSIIDMVDIAAWPGVHSSNRSPTKTTAVLNRRDLSTNEPACSASFVTKYHGFMGHLSQILQ